MGLTKEDLEAIWSRVPIANFIPETQGLLKYIEKVSPLETILEIGVGFGGSLRLWEAVLPPNGTLIALDNHPDTIKRITGEISVPQLQADSKGWKTDWEVGATNRNVYSLISPKNVYVVIGDSSAPETKNIVEGLLNGRQIDFIFHDGMHYGPVPVRDYANYQHLLRTGGLLCIADVADFNNENCGCQELYRALPEPKIPRTQPCRQGMALWTKPEDFVLDAEEVIRRTGLVSPA